MNTSISFPNSELGHRLNGVKWPNTIHVHKHPEVGLDPNGVPEELRKIPRWVCWRYENRNGSWTKVPVSLSTGRAIDVNNPANWAGFAEAVEALQRFPDSAGVGFVFNGDGYCGIDLDACIDARSVLSPEAHRILKDFSSYTEYSPSGTGVKIFVRGVKPAGAKCTSGAVVGIKKVEIYDDKRFFTVTGHGVVGTPGVVNDAQAELHRLCNQIWPNGASRPTRAGSSFAGSVGSDAELIRVATEAKNGAKFRALWVGDTAGHGHDHNRADLALCGLLAFWTRGDSARIDRLFRQSGLYRAKWDEPRGDRTYGELTIARAIASCRVSHVPRLISPQRIAGATDDRRPEILIDTEEHRVIREAVAALANDSEVFQRGGRLVRVIGEPVTQPGIIRGEGTLTIASIELPNLRERLSAQARFVRRRKDQLLPAHQTPWLVQGVGGRSQWDGIRVLSSISATPVLRPDGTLLQTPGYDEATGVLFVPSGKFPEVSATPSREDARAAMDSLSEVVSDFRFETEAHRAAYLAFVLTPLARFAFDGPAPLFLIDANVRGAGKGLLAQIAGRIALGHDIPVSSYSHDTEELRKRITSVVMAGDRMVLFDNLEGRLGNATLDRALTTTRWRDRVLGSNGMVDLPLKTVWCATGNNVMIGADTSRRIIHIRLDVLDQRPEERSGFRHADILQYVREQRARLVVAGLTVLGAYFHAGRPGVALKPMGSFEGWSELIRQAVVWVGLPDPCITRSGIALLSDSTEAALAQLMDAWRLYHPGDHGVVIAALLARLYSSEGDCPTDSASVAMRAAIENLVCGAAGKQPTPKQVGNRLRAYRRRVLDGMMFDLDERETRRAGSVWRLRTVG